MKFRDISNESQETYTIQTGGVFVFFFQNRSGKIEFDITHPEARVYIYGLILGKDTEKYTIRTHQIHSTPGAQSELLLKSVLYEASQFTFNGTITIKPSAQKTQAKLVNNNLLVGEEAYAETAPNLNILTNDVQCSHAATTSQLNQEQLLYLRFRGIDPEKAQKLLIEGFIHDIFLQLERKGIDKTMLDH